MSNFRNLLKRNLEFRITSMTKTGTTNRQTKDTRNQETKAKKNRKNKTENQATGSSGNKQADQPDSLTCHICNQVLTDENTKIICCDRCEYWYCIKCANIPEAGYAFLASQDAEAVAWYCRPCKLPAKTTVLEEKSIEDKCKEYMERINQRMETIESSIQRKAEKTTVEEVQKKIEDIEKKIKIIEEGKEGRKSWADIMETPEKKTVEEAIEKQLRDRENEEKDRQNRKNNIIIFGLPESKATENEQRKDEDIKRIVGLSKTICQVNITEEAISRAIRLGKLNEEKDRPLLITLKEEEKKRQLFQNLNKIRDAGEPFNKVIITHDLTKKQKDELKQLVEQAKEKEKEDQSGEYMYHVRGPPWSWFMMKIPKKCRESSNYKDKNIPMLKHQVHVY